MKTITGVKNPRWESKNTISKKLDKYKIDKNQVYIFDTAEDAKKFWSTKRTFLHIKVYGKDGKGIISNDSSKCLSYIQNYAIKYKDTSSAKQIFNSNLVEMSLNLKNLITNEKLSLTAALSKSINIFVYYANFIGKNHFKHLKEMQEIAKKEKQNIIFINCDFREEWKDSLKLNLKTAR